MKKSDLKYGNVVETRNGHKLLLNKIYGEPILIFLNCKGFILLDSFDIELKDGFNVESGDIIKVYKDYTCKELLWERKENPKLTEDEKVVLRNLPKKYKWIARDKSDWIFLYKEKPIKLKISWSGCMYTTLPFKHLFQFIQWEDEEPYSIEELLKGE